MSRLLLCIATATFFFLAPFQDESSVGADSILNSTTSLTPAFIQGRSFPSGLKNIGSTIGDFNNDGKLDVAVINDAGFNSTISVMRGNGDGTFQAPVTTPMEPNGVRLATGDFNQDGKLDLVVALSAAGAVGLMPGNGDGTFGFTDLYTAQAGTGRLVVADFNGDGKLDVATSNFSAVSFSVFLGNGSGSLGLATNYQLPTGPNRVTKGIAAADFDQDGDADLLVSFMNEIWMYKNSGNGAFSFDQAFSSGTGYTKELTSGDISGDGVPDILSGGENNVPGGGNAYLRAHTASANAGSATFVLRGERLWGIEDVFAHVRDMAVADIDGDGRNDIVGLNNYNGNLSVIFTEPNGSFKPSINNYYAGLSPLNVHLRDLNGDSRPDVVVTNENGTSFQVLMNLGNGRLGGSYSVSLMSFVTPNVTDGVQLYGTEGGLILGHLNDDSLLDLFAMSNAHQNTNYGTALGDSLGRFSGQAVRDPTTPRNGEYVQAGALADFNGDGKTDFLHGISFGDNPLVASSLRYLSGRGDGTFAVPNVTFQIPAVSEWVIAGDFNNDSRQDAVAAIAGTNQISFLRGNGQGSFNSAVNTTVGTRPMFVVAAHFNSDGNLDVATANYGSNNVSILLGNGNGTFTAATNFPVGTKPAHITAADVNADGVLDLVVANHGGSTVSVLIGNGSGGFGSATSVTVGNTPIVTSVADLNNDGIVDIATANRTSNSISINLGTGNGSFAAPTHISYGMHEPLSVIARDVNSDSYPDLIFTHLNSPQINILINSTVNSISGRVTTPGMTGLRNATVTLVDSTGVRRTATTSSFGLYSFENLPGGQNYTISVASKRYRFTPRVLPLTGSLMNVDFVGLE